jgi:hypothetical protein
MFRNIASVSMVMIVFGAASAFAQEPAPGPGRVEVTYMPGGAAYVVSKDDAPSFGNYGFGTSLRGWASNWDEAANGQWARAGERFGSLQLPRSSFPAKRASRIAAPAPSAGPTKAFA